MKGKGRNEGVGGEGKRRIRWKKNSKSDKNDSVYSKREKESKRIKK